ncbi:MAG: DUF86 domain-containing protein [Elusimicrobia bacterium]|nr:DUF86 domain-containing protein [Elusimicrobiota bacterium]
MSKRDFRLFVNDMLESINKIDKWTKNISFDSFTLNDMAVDAVIRNLEIIDEAAKQIPEEIRLKYPVIPWKKAAGFRDIAIHVYFDVDLQTIWTICTKSLPEIKPHVAQMLKDFKNRP